MLTHCGFLRSLCRRLYSRRIGKISLSVTAVKSRYQDVDFLLGVPTAVTFHNRWSRRLRRRQPVIAARAGLRRCSCAYPHCCMRLGSIGQLSLPSLWDRCHCCMRVLGQGHNRHRRYSVTAPFRPARFRQTEVYSHKCSASWKIREETTRLISARLTC